MSNATPKLRFPDFSSDRAWRESAFDELYDFKPTNSLSRDKLSETDGDIRNIHYGDIHTKLPARLDAAEHALPFIAASEDVNRLRDKSFCALGDMVFADASEDMADVGKSLEIVGLGEEKVVAGTHTILATRKGNQPKVGFGGHLFRTSHIRSQIQRESQGAKVLGISPKRLATIKVPLPPTHAEQQKIADCLTSLDALIQAQGRKVAALKAHKTGLMQQLFPRVDESAPRLRFREFQGNGPWKTTEIGKLFDTATGGTPSRQEGDYWGGSVPWVTTSLVDFNLLSGATECITEAGLSNSSAKVFPENTVIIAMYGQGKTRGKVAMLMTEAATNQACVALLPNNAVQSSYTFLYLCSRYAELRDQSNSGGQKNLSQGLIRKLPFCFPESEAEQAKISACLLAADRVIASAKQRLRSLERSKEGLLQQLFPSPSSP